MHDEEIRKRLRDLHIYKEDDIEYHARRCAAFFEIGSGRRKKNKKK